MKFSGNWSCQGDVIRGCGCIISICLRLSSKKYNGSQTKMPPPPSFRCHTTSKVFTTKGRRFQTIQTQFFGHLTSHLSSIPSIISYDFSGLWLVVVFSHGPSTCPVDGSYEFSRHIGYPLVPSVQVLNRKPHNIDNNSRCSFVYIRFVLSSVLVTCLLLVLSSRERRITFGLYSVGVSL